MEVVFGQGGCKRGERVRIEVAFGQEREKERVSSPNRGHIRPSQPISPVFKTECKHNKVEGPQAICSRDLRLFRR